LCGLTKPSWTLITLQTVTLFGNSIHHINSMGVQFQPDIKSPKDVVESNSVTRQLTQGQDSKGRVRFAQEASCIKCNMPAWESGCPFSSQPIAIRDTGKMKDKICVCEYAAVVFPAKRGHSYARTDFEFTAKTFFTATRGKRNRSNQETKDISKLVQLEVYGRETTCCTQRSPTHVPTACPWEESWDLITMKCYLLEVICGNTPSQSMLNCPPSAEVYATSTSTTASRVGKHRSCACGGPLSGDLPSKYSVSTREKFLGCFISCNRRNFQTDVLSNTGRCRKRLDRSSTTAISVK
jgi:hypothetical protein